jgi:hypothetical protein
LPLFRFRIDEDAKVYQALVVAAEAARESPLQFDVGPWEDQELRELGVIEISGPDEAAELVVNRWIDDGIGFEYADDLAVS